MSVDSNFFVDVHMELTPLPIRPPKPNLLPLCEYFINDRSLSPLYGCELNNCYFYCKIWYDAAFPGLDENKYLLEFAGNSFL